MSDTHDTTGLNSQSDTLDVRVIVPAQRHPLIFQRFAALATGEGFTLVNDHDPKPLYYQLNLEYSGQLGWDYLEKGPEVWRVRISRTPARGHASLPTRPAGQSAE